MVELELEERTEQVEENPIHAAYVAVRDNVGDGEIIGWEELSTLFGLEVPKPEDLEWTRYVQRRCAMKTAVNKKAARNVQPWRLYIHSQGEEIIKQHKTFMVKAEIVDRMGKIERGLSLASTSAKAMRIAEG